MMNPSILVVDDDEVFRGVVMKMLQKDGYAKIFEAESGMDAVIMADRCSPDLVIMDIVMPDMDGINAAREITTISPAAKIVMMTGAGTPSRVSDCMSVGAANVIFKPFEYGQLKAVVRRALGIH